MVDHRSTSGAGRQSNASSDVAVGVRHRAEAKGSHELLDRSDGRRRHSGTADGQQGSGLS